LLQYGNQQEKAVGVPPKLLEQERGQKADETACKPDKWSVSRV